MRTLLSRAKYGCASVSNPVNALQHDSDVNDDTSYDDASVRAMYSDQLTQLENLIARQHVCQHQMREQLVAVEKQYHSVICFLCRVSVAHFFWFSRTVSKGNFWRLLEWIFLRQMFFLPPSHQCESTEGTQSTNPNQWPGLILSSSTDGLLTEGALLPLCRLSNTSSSSEGTVIGELCDSLQCFDTDDLVAERTSARK